MFILALFVCVGVSAFAQPTITLDQALGLARMRAPQLIAARDRIEEARGRLIGASVLLQENTAVVASVGPRYSSNGNTTDYDISVSQQLELGGQRRARIEGARAGIARETANSRDAARLLLRDVAFAFTRGLAARERLRLAEASSNTADELLHSMNRRFLAGDVPILDVNLTRNTSARAHAEVRSAKAAYVSAIGDLRILLGMTADEPLEIAGDLRDRQRFDLPNLMGRVGDRPDLHALAAEKAEANAEVQLGTAFRWPTVAPAFSYKRDQRDNVVQGGLTFTLPIFNRGQELQAVGQARTRRLDRELEATRRAVSVEVRTAFDAYNLQVAAVEEIEREALPGLEENETLARRSFEEGEIGLAELLLIRREGFDLRLVYAERLLEAAIGGIELQSRAGVLQ